MAELELDGVSKVFQDGDEAVRAVDDVSLTIGDGEFLVVVGPSGCGKSTTLRMVAGLETVTEGEIRLDGEAVTGVKPQDRDVAMVFQSYALYPHMTVRGNMAFGLEESTELPADEIDRKVSEAADLMGIPELLDRKPSDLSGGQRQRVALGRAIVRDPQVFLMDEPLSNLDAKLRSQMRTELQRLQDDLGVTTMYVTHDQTEAMTMGDRIAILDGGRLQQVATPLECYHEPSNRFVAGFLGEPSMNFLEGELSEGRFVSPELSYPLSDSILSAVEGADGLTMGIRPEAVELRSATEGAHDFDAVVDVVEPMGNENVVYLNLGADDDGDEAAVADAPVDVGGGDLGDAEALGGDRHSLVATTEGMHEVTSGDRLAVRIPEDAVHFFDRATGVALHNRSRTEAASGPQIQ